MKQNFPVVRGAASCGQQPHTTGRLASKEHHMSKLATALCLALISATALDVSVAEAGPEVRDHRAAPAPAGGASASVHYRRRPGPKVMLPLKIDIGAAGQNTSQGFARGISAAVGVHWASLSPTPTRLDIGIGVFGALLATPADPSKMMDSEGIALGGAYLEAGYALAAGTWWRTFATARGEYVGSAGFGNSHAGFGGTGRLSAELFSSGVGIEPRGLFLGAYAFGVYVEAGGRDMADGIGAFHAAAGLTFRTPLVFAP